MGKLFDDTMQGLLEAALIEKGNIPLAEKEGMPGKTYVAFDKDQDLIAEFIRIRKEQKVSQSKLAEITGNKQQVISRIEKNEQNPSLKLFYCLVSALGYELRLEKVES